MNNDRNLLMIILIAACAMLMLGSALCQEICQDIPCYYLVNQDQYQLSLRNNGIGSCIRLFKSTNNADTWPILYLQTEGDYGAGVKIDCSNQSFAGHAIDIYYAGPSSAVYVYDGYQGGAGVRAAFRAEHVQSGHGMWLEGSSGGSMLEVANTQQTQYAYAGHFTKTSGTADVVLVEGNGHAVHGISGGASETAAVFGEHNGVGYAVFGKANGAGYGVCGLASNASSVAAKFSNSSNGTMPVLIATSLSGAYIAHFQNTGTGARNGLRIALTDQNNTGIALTSVLNGNGGTAIACSTNGTTGNGFAAYNPGGNGYCYSAIVTTLQGRHDAKLANFFLNDMYNTTPEPFRVSSNGEGHAVVVKRLHPGGEGQPIASALDVWQAGNGPIIEEHRIYGSMDGPGTVIDIDCAQGQGMIVRLDSTANDSNGIEVFHRGEGNGIYAEIDNSHNDKHAIYGKVANGTGKAGYFEGDVQVTKQLLVDEDVETAGYLKAGMYRGMYQVNDHSQNPVDIPDNYQEGDFVLVKDTNDSPPTYWLVVVTTGGDAKGVKVDEKFTVQ